MVPLNAVKADSRPLIKLSGLLASAVANAWRPAMADKKDAKLRQEHKEIRKKISFSSLT
jgi:hypothetical protein